jgi:hypothetical protein
MARKYWYHVVRPGSTPAPMRSATTAPTAPRVIEVLCEPPVYRTLILTSLVCQKSRVSHPTRSSGTLAVFCGLKLGLKGSTAQRSKTPIDKPINITAELPRSFALSRLPHFSHGRLPAKSSGAVESFSPHTGQLAISNRMLPSIRSRPRQVRNMETRRSIFSLGSSAISKMARSAKTSRAVSRLARHRST